MTKYILTIGLNDKDTYTQKYDTITAYKMIEQILAPRTNGYTMYETHGGYQHDNEYLTICYYNLKEKYIRGQKDFSSKNFEKLTKFYLTKIK